MRYRSDRMTPGVKPNKLGMRSAASALSGFVAKAITGLQAIVHSSREEEFHGWRSSNPGRFTNGRPPSDVRKPYKLIAATTAR